jgi:hypothetical protein
MNEEQIKISYVVPWLIRAGVNTDELTYETSFSLKIGRNDVIVGGENRRHKDSVGARLDILLKRAGRNLLIIETKAENLVLTDDDRDQAISYARLVHPIAPYALVTNGREFRLFDSVSREEIEPGSMKVGQFEITLPSDLIAEAQRLFLASSPENLLAFCRAQSQQALSHLVGDPQHLEKKYVRELHIVRDAVATSLKEFLSSSTPGLIFTGPSGWGKSCDLCWAADLLLAEDRPVLFFNGSLLERDIVHAVAAEFSWSFESQANESAILKRLAQLKSSIPLTIIVDAIDEWNYEQRVQHLTHLLSAACASNIKIIASCKSSTLDEFLRVRGLRTPIDSLSVRLEVPAFSEREFYCALEQYRSVYEFQGGFETSVLDEARHNPFLLRVLFDVARTNEVDHITFSSSQFFEQYYRSTVERTGDARKASLVLLSLAELLWEKNVDWISENELKAHLGLGRTDEIFLELFHFEILQRNRINGVETIGFYFQQLRDYIIAFISKCFAHLSPSEFAGALGEGLLSGPRADVITLYYRLASSEHQRVLDSAVYDNAVSYLETYLSVLHQDFANIKTKFPPFTSGRVGFIGELDLAQKRLQMYGFRPIEGEDSLIHFVPIQRELGAGEEHSNLIYLDGADRLHATSSACGLAENINITREVINGEVLPQVRQLIICGELDESDCVAMSLEELTQLIIRNSGIFPSLLNPARTTLKYPITFEKVIRCLLEEKLRREHESDVVDEHRVTGAITDTWNGSAVSYNYEITG